MYRDQLETLLQDQVALIFVVVAMVVKPLSFGSIKIRFSLNNASVGFKILISSNYPSSTNNGV